LFGSPLGGIDQSRKAAIDDQVDARLEVLVVEWRSCERAGKPVPHLRNLRLPSRSVAAPLLDYHLPAVNIHRRTRDIPSLIGGQEEHESRHFFRSRQSAKRYPGIDAIREVRR
jgi:hypothetical protein